MLVVVVLAVVRSFRIYTLQKLANIRHSSFVAKRYRCGPVACSGYVILMSVCMFMIMYIYIYIYIYIYLFPKAYAIPPTPKVSYAP